jgi:hypothetical protein
MSRGLKTLDRVRGRVLPSRGRVVLNPAALAAGVTPSAEHYHARKVTKSEGFPFPTLKSVYNMETTIAILHVSHRGIFEGKQLDKTASSSRKPHPLRAIHVLQKEVNEDGMRNHRHPTRIGQLPNNLACLYDTAKKSAYDSPSCIGAAFTPKNQPQMYLSESLS